MKNLLIVLFLIIHATAWSQTTTIDTVKEVFLKGSIDGENMFMVLGMQDGFEYSKEVMRDSINMEDLKYLGDNVLEVKEDLKDFKSVLKEPWDSIKKIPGSYKVEFEKAQSSYYGANGPISGVLKYSGWAVWANIKGAYYLVIEAPTVMVYQTVSNSIATSWSISGLGLRVSWNLLKPAFGALWSTTVMTYSAVSSSIATTATLIAAGGVATFKGGKWLFVTLPSKLFSPVAVEMTTKYNFEEQRQVAQTMNDLLVNAKDIFGMNILIESKLQKYNSEFKIKAEELKINAFVLKTSVKNKNVNLKLEVTKEYIKNVMKQTGMNKKEAKAKLTSEAKEILTKIIEHI